MATFLASDLKARVVSGELTLEAAQHELAIVRVDLSTLGIRAKRHRDLGRGNKAATVAETAVILAREIQAAERFLAAELLELMVYRQIEEDYPDLCVNHGGRTWRILSRNADRGVEFNGYLDPDQGWQIFQDAEICFRLRAELVEFVDLERLNPDWVFEMPGIQIRVLRTRIERMNSTEAA